LPVTPSLGSGSYSTAAPSIKSIDGRPFLPEGLAAGPEPFRRGRGGTAPDRACSRQRREAPALERAGSARADSGGEADDQELGASSCRRGPRPRRGTSPGGGNDAAGAPSSASAAGNSAPSGGQPEIGTATITPTGIPPSQRNPLLTDNGAVRVAKLIGQNIFNKDDKKLGNVEDVLVGQGGGLQVVVATGSKKVEGLNKLPEFSYRKPNKD
jgi:hypothetical protein